MDNAIKKGDIIVLNDQKNYVIVSQITYEENVYGYLCELGNIQNVKFVQFESDNQLSIIDNDESELLAKLILLFADSNKINF